VLVVVLWFAIQRYLSERFQGVTPGMSRAQVDSHLRAFAIRPGTYQVAQGDTVVDYELLWLGKSGTIKVIFGPDGKPCGVIPAFDN
jgi:hypothetical protein